MLETQNTKNNPEDHDEKHSGCERVLHCETYLLLGRYSILYGAVPHEHDGAPSRTETQ